MVRKIKVFSYKPLEKKTTSNPDTTQDAESHTISTDKETVI